MTEQGIIRELCGEAMDEYDREEEVYFEANDVAMAFAKLESRLLAEVQKKLDEIAEKLQKQHQKSEGLMFTQARQEGALTMIDTVLELLIGKQEAKVA